VVARLIATDRRTVILATTKADVLLSNAPTTRPEMESEAILSAFDWTTLCAHARRAGSVAASAQIGSAVLEGELVHLQLGTSDAFLLRLAETNQEAAVLRNRSRTATLLRVSHDLRTPIQSLLSVSEAAFTSPQTDLEALARGRERMRRSAELALSHIDNVIKVIRGEMTAAELQVDEPFDLAHEVRMILDMVEPIAVARGAEIVFSEVPQQATWVRGPVRFVRALLQNMIDNSAKHGGKKVEIRLFCRPQYADPSKTNITIEVADLGGGLPLSQKTRLLRAIGSDGAHDTEPQKDGTTEANLQPSRPSAGLNVLAHALTQLGGRIEVLDRAEDGKTVISSPEDIVGTILKAHFSLDAAEDEAKTESELPHSASSPVSTLAGIGVLIVEDSPSSRDWLVETLKRVGAHVHAVDNGMNALEILRSHDAPQKIDLLLSDMTLPHMSGVELTRRIRAGQTSGEIAWQGKILGLTAHVDNRLRDACLALGMVKVLEKPVRHAQLCQSIRDALALHPEASIEARDLPDTSTVTQPVSPPTSATPPTFADEAVTELIDHMQLAGAKGFMQRALSEAQAAHDDIVANGPSADTGRILHAATGACGITGLALLERTLRNLELALGNEAADLKPDILALDQALRETATAIDQLC
jgi:CheY-like chemotaxis protein